MPVKRLAQCAVTAALLTAVQYVLSFAAGVELVTPVLAAFSYVFGAGCGILTAIAFSLIRCLIFGFYPNVALLYLIYYPLFALLFGLLKKRRPPACLGPAALYIMAAAALAGGTFGLPVSAAYKTGIRVMLFVLAGVMIFLGTFSAAMYLRKGDKPRERAVISADAAALATLMTVLFTLLDDLITPLFMGLGQEAAAAYFYGGFLAMIPQTLCAAVSVSVLFWPLKSAFEAIDRRP